MKTEPPVEESISQAEPELQNTDVGPSQQDEVSATTSSAGHQLSICRLQQKMENNPTDL